MDRLFLWAVSFCACEKKYHVRPKTANRHGSEKIMLSRQALLSKMNVFLKSACYILSPLAPYFPLYVLFGPWFNVSNAPFLLLSMLSLMKHPHISLSYSHYTFGLLFAHFPALYDLAILPLLHSIFLMFFPPCFNSIMDVHKAQFTSRAFSIISELIHSLRLLLRCVSLWRQNPALFLRSPCLRAHSISQTPNRPDRLHLFASVHV